MWIELRTHNNKLLLCTVYRPPNAGNNFWNLFQESVAMAKESDISYLVITGDLNADPDSPCGQVFANFLAANHLVAHIEEPTRVTNNSAKILDQFVSNIPDFVRNIQIQAPVSSNDHCTIGLGLSFRVKRKKTYSRIIWDFKHANWIKHREALDRADFASCVTADDIDTCSEELTTIILDAAKASIPNKLIVVRPSDKPWYNERLRTMCRTKNRLHQKAKRTTLTDDWARYRESRNDYFQEIKSAKSDFENNKYASLIADGQRNSKKWWHILKSLLGQTNDSDFPPLHAGNQIITDNKEKATAFNDFFTSAAQLDDTNAQLPEYHADKEVSLEDITVSNQDVLDQIEALDTTKAYGPDGLSPIFLKEGKLAIAPVLTKLFNLSIKKGMVPQIWKQANVLPIFKKGKRELLNNYRPVSLLSCNAKLLEKVIFKYVFNFFRDNFLITIWQSGFLPGRSTITQLTELYHTFCKAVAEGKEIRIVFLDISKAFDRVWHKGLLHKLQNFGIKGKLLAWFTNYLKDRRQRVVIGGQASDWTYLKSGVPQGAVLGPLLFLVFIDDIVYIVTHCKIRLFADDTCLFVEVDNREETALQINEDLERISKWANDWLITFSPPKTKSLIISNKSNVHLHPDLRLEGHVIDRVNHHKHLGITLSHNLRWNCHIEDIVTKALRKLDLMRGLKFKLDRKSLETVYISFIRPCIEYGDVLWAGTYDSDLCKVDSIQVEAMRIVTGATARSNINNLYEETGWPTLSERRLFHVHKLMYKMVNELAPSYLSDLLPDTVGQRVTYGLRNEAELRMPFTRTESFRRSFIPFGIRVWKNLTDEVKNLPTLEAFSAATKPKTQERRLFEAGRRLPALHHARIRIGCSKLNAHLCLNLHVIQNPSCHCGYEVEDPMHFFLHCPLYNNERNRMNAVIINKTEVTLEHILYGNPDLDFKDNLTIFDVVHTFILETKRFIN